MALLSVSFSFFFLVVELDIQLAFWSCCLLLWFFSFVYSSRFFLCFWCDLWFLIYDILMRYFNIRMYFCGLCLYFPFLLYICLSAAEHLGNLGGVKQIPETFVSCHLLYDG